MSNATATKDITSLSIKPSQAARLLAHLLPENLPILLVGPPGVGKTDIVHQACEAIGANLIISHPVVADSTDAKGLPWVDVNHPGQATFLPFGELAEAMAATEPTIWFLDDLGQAAPSVQASFMQLILARRVNGHKLPDCITFIAATNRRTDRAGVTGILEPVKSRFATIVEISPDLGDWCSWALAHDVPPEVVAFIRLRPELLHQFQASADMVNSPAPRTWNHAGKLVALGLPKDLEFAALSGAVGQGAATELVSFLQIYRDMPSLDGILLDPQKADIPKQPSVLYAVAAGLGHKANVANFDRIAQYAERLAKAGKAEFAVLMVRDASRRNPEVMNTTGFVKMVSGPLGRIINGEA